MTDIVRVIKAKAFERVVKLSREDSMATIHCDYWTEKLGAEIKRLSSQDPDGFDMEIVDPDEYEAIAQAWNMGIDSHLEAISTRSTCSQSNGRAYINIHPDELHVLVRRLMNNVATEAAETLARDICYVLGIQVY